jgi:hypothetical protein
MIYIQITIGVALYCFMCLVLARFCGINNMRHNRLRWPAYPKQERRQGTDRRRRQAAIICNYRQQERRRHQPWQVLNNARGVTVVVVTILLGTVLVPFAALAIDVGIMHIRKTEAAAAADSVALGGASALFDSEPRPEFSDMPGANAVAGELASANGATCTHQLGHFNLSTRTFTPGALGGVPDWENATLLEAYQDTFFTNAVAAECSVEGSGPISGRDFTATAVAIAMHRIGPAPEGETGIINVVGSMLTK